MSFSRAQRTIRFASALGIAFYCLAPSPSHAQLTITESVAPTLGTLMGGAANRNFVLNTDDTVTGGNAADYMFGAVSGQVIFMKRQGPELVSIVAENVLTTGGLIVNAILCQWHNGPALNCVTPGE